MSYRELRRRKLAAMVLLCLKYPSDFEKRVIIVTRSGRETFNHARRFAKELPDLYKKDGDAALSGLTPHKEEIRDLLQHWNQTKLF